MRNINIRMVSLFSFIILSWSLGWPVAKVGLEYMPSFWYTAFELMIGTITMMAFVIVTKKFSLPKWEDFPLIAAIGLLQIGVYMLLASIGLSYLPAGRSSLLAYTTPLWIMPAAVLFFNEEAGMLRWAGFFIAVGGLLLLLSPWEMDWTDGNIIFGSAILLLASLSWAISMLCARYLKWTKSPLELIPWQLLISTIPILFFAWIKEPFHVIQWNLPLLLSLGFSGVIVTGLSYWVGVIINKELPTIVLSLGLLLVPVFSLVFSALFMHEVISVMTMIAISMIILGLGCVAS